jgi:uncharacterized membrane protein (UPF0182 family)
VRQIEGDAFSAYRALAEQLRRVLLVFLPIVAALFAGLAASSQWQTAAVFANSTKTGDVDAQFGLDVSFYLFELPFYTFVVGFFSTLIFFALVLSIAAHVVFGNIRFGDAGLATDLLDQLREFVAEGGCHGFPEGLDVARNRRQLLVQDAKLTA